MKFTGVLATAICAFVSVTASPIHRREVPQEHSHDIIVNQIRPILQVNSNTLPDPIFALLGNAAASKAIADNKTKQTDPDCLQQNIADQSITNCKSGKITNLSQADCIAVAIKYRALERNSGSVGATSGICKTAPVNDELKTITQHQDPASDNALTVNGDVEVAVAKALVALGLSADAAASGALETATFGPGQKGDPTAQGLSCDNGAGGKFGDSIVADADGVDPITNFAFKKGDQIDCITDADVKNGKSKRVPAKSRAELIAAVGGAAAGGNGNVAAGGQQNGDGGNAATSGNTATGAIDFTAIADLLKQAIALLEPQTN
ncbi:hypothetical protein HK098_000973 [Nowakowskiella sp. JEL0407]|nr:hypothetical protein HK098_000973 [Nowakowskiella sp. JEL0407]